jgi:hypothetical protein
MFTSNREGASPRIYMAGELFFCSPEFDSEPNHTSKSKECSVNMAHDYSSPRGYFRGVMGIESEHYPNVNACISSRGVMLLVA